MTHEQRVTADPLATAAWLTTDKQRVSPKDSLTDPPIAERQDLTLEQRHRLSALQDGELDPASTSRLLDLGARDPRLRATWERYHLIGQAIRGESVDPAYRGIADSVRRSIAAEPARPAPRRPVLPLGYRHPSLAGLAIAASAAFVAVFTAPALFQESDTHPHAGVTAPAVVSQEPLPDARLFPDHDSLAGKAETRWHLDRPDLANKLDLFLVTHQETVPLTGAKGMLPYATLVSY